MSAADIDQGVKKRTHATAAQGRSYPRRSVHMLKDELEAFLYHRMSLRLDSSSEARTVRVQWCASHDAATPTVERSGCQPGVVHVEADRVVSLSRDTTSSEISAGADRETVLIWFGYG